MTKLSHPEGKTRDRAQGTWNLGGLRPIASARHSSLGMLSVGR